MEIKVFSFNDDRRDEIIGTSYSGVMVDASRKDLIQVLGEPTYESGCVDDKVQYEWDMSVTIDGEEHVITLYDWKEYRVVDEYEDIEWHLGSHRNVSESFVNAVKQEIERRVDSIVREV